MNPLPNAPLKSVTFRIRWHITNEKEFDSIQYIHGDYFNRIKNKFQIRSNLVEPELPLAFYFDKLSHEFKKKEVEFPRIQLGPKQLTVNTIEGFYKWADFKIDIEDAIRSLDETLKEHFTPDHFHLYLDYIDFIEFNFAENDILEYMSKYLHLDVQQKFYENKPAPKKFNISLDYENEIGKLSVVVGSGNFEEKNGILIKTSAISGLVKPDMKTLTAWLDGAYHLCSSNFKNMTEGDLYESFK